MFFSRVSIAFLAGVFALGAAKADSNDWLLPNFANRLTVEVSNPGSEMVDALATLPISKAQEVAPEFPGRLALAVVLHSEGSAQPGNFVASQVDDLDGDGNPDEFEFPVRLAPGERRRVDIYYSTTLHDSVAWPKRVQAKHRCGYNEEVAAFESELIGYRTYGGFFLDFQAREANRTGLNNDLSAYVPVRRDLGTGRDVFHIGSTLGLGGIFLRRDGKVYQPPMNVPTYAHKPSPEMVPHYRILAAGPLHAVIETTLNEWEIGEDVIRLRATYSIDAGESFARCRVEAVPLHLAPNHRYEVGVGIRNLPQESYLPAPGRMVETGQQNARDGDIGLALYFDARRFSPIASLRTADGNNHAVIANSRLGAGQVVQEDYAVAGAWSGSGISDLKASLTDLAKAVHAKVTIGSLEFSRTPHPEKVDAEAQ